MRNTGKAYALQVHHQASATECDGGVEWTLVDALSLIEAAGVTAVAACRLPTRQQEAGHVRERHRWPASLLLRDEI